MLLQNPPIVDVDWNGLKTSVRVQFLVPGSEDTPFFFFFFYFSRRFEEPSDRLWWSSSA